MSRWHDHLGITILRKSAFEHLTPYNDMEIPYVLCYRCLDRKWLAYLCLADVMFHQCQGRVGDAYCGSKIFFVGNQVMTRLDMLEKGLIHNEGTYRSETRLLTQKEHP